MRAWFCLTMGALWCAAGMSFSMAAQVPKGVELAAKQELVRSNGSEPETLDPALAESVGANQITRDLFEGLTATTSSGQTVPGVAISWKQTNPTTWVFTLRKDAKFSNGEAISADDFVYGWRRYLDPKTASQYATTLAPFILNGMDVAEGKKPTTELGVKALAKDQLEVKTPFPVAFLLDLLSNTQFAPINKAVVEKFGKDWTKPGNMVGNGAYVLKEWRVNSAVVVEKNPHYWDAKSVVLKKISFLPVEDSNADVKMFQSGETDYVYALPPGSYEQFKKSNPADIKNGPMLGLRFYALNNKDPLLKDVRVRKALSMVIDRDILAAKVTADGQIPAYGVIVKGIEGADVVPRASPASPRTTSVPACAMKALMWPTLPPTTMSTPFIEMPQRAAASPSTPSSPPWAVAPADCDALPVTHTVPLIMFSPTPTPALPRIVTVACWFMPAA